MCYWDHWQFVLLPPSQFSRFSFLLLVCWSYVIIFIQCVYFPTVWTLRYICSLSYCMAVRHRLNSDYKRWWYLPLQNCEILLKWVCIKPVIAPWDWLEACTVHECQLNRHMVHYPEVSLTRQVIFVGDNSKWMSQKGWFSQSLYIEQGKWLHHGVLKMGRKPAWRLAWRNTYLAS